MAAYVIFDVDIRDMNQYQELMKGVKPAVEAAGGKYLARGGAHKVYEGDWEPRRIVLFEFPSVAAFESFYNGPTYQGLKPVRDACSSARLVSVEGLAYRSQSPRVLPDMSVKQSANGRPTCPRGTVCLSRNSRAGRPSAVVRSTLR